MKHDVRIYDAEQQSMFLSEWLDESRATTPAALALAGSSSRERNILCFGLRYVHMLIHTEPPGKGLYLVARNFCLALPGCCLAKHTYLFRGLCSM